MSRIDQPSTEAYPNQRLSGWKEIASYLHKSVRTAQRWERELGLPVRRIHTDGGEIVHACTSEIEAWLTSKGLQSVSTDKGSIQVHSGGTELKAASITQVSTPAVMSLFRRRPHVWTAFAVLAVLTATVGVPWASRGWASLAKSAAQPASWQVKDGELESYNEHGRPLWRPRFEHRLNDQFYRSTARPSPDRLVLIVDLEGDGRNEVVLVGMWTDSNYTSFFVLESDGSVRFDHRLPDVFQFGSERYAAPWCPVWFQVTAEPDGTKTIWLVSHHHLWFPSLLQKISPRGEVLATYVSNGHIASLRETTASGRRMMVAGATNNDHLAASLAFLDYDKPSGSAPASKTHYRCSNCPSGDPWAFFIFPRTELSEKTGERPSLTEIRLDGSGNLLLDVSQGVFPDLGHSAGILYRLSLEVEPRVLDAETTDSYRVLHAQVELRNRLNHPFRLACEKQLFPVLRWDHASERFIPEYGKLANPPR